MDFGYRTLASCPQKLVPCCNRHSDKPVGSREYFDEVEKRKYFVEPHIPGFADFARWSGKTAIGLGIAPRSGANTVEVAEEQAQLLRKGIGDIFVNLARRNQSLLDRQIEFRSGDIYPLLLGCGETYLGHVRKHQLSGPQKQAPELRNVASLRKDMRAKGRERPLEGARTSIRFTYRPHKEGTH